jgi:hypothetical protein
MMSNLSKYIIALVLILFILSGCISKEDDGIKDDEVINIEEVKETEKENPNEMENKVESDFYNKYIKLAEYLEGNVEQPELTEEEKLIKEKYFKLLSVPENIYELDYNFEFIKRIEFDGENSLDKWYLGNATEGYPGLNMVTKNEELCFDAYGKYWASKYIVNKDEWVRYGEGYKYCPEFIEIESIFYEGEWRKIVIDKFKNGDIYIENNSERIILGNYNDFPLNYDGAYLIKPIDNYISIWKTYYNVIHLNKRLKSTDRGFLYYDLENNQAIKEYILPGTDKYETFKELSTPVRTIDSEGRIYLRLDDMPLHGNRDGHIMILDIENDTLYNIHHPYYIDANENDDGYDNNYVVGEDDNIYIQFMTDQAYYIYKITPLWDSIEETEYNPRFIEYYPELQEVWDGL